MKVYIVWEYIDGFPGLRRRYIESIFLNYDKAKAFCEKKQKEAKEDEEGDIISYEVRPYEVKEDA